MLIEITQHNMDNDTDKIIDRTEEILKDSANGDIDAIRDTSNYINWLTVLASGGIALVISQKDKILSGNQCLHQDTVLIISTALLFLSIIIVGFGSTKLKKALVIIGLYLLSVECNVFLFIEKR